MFRKCVEIDDLKEKSFKGRKNNLNELKVNKPRMEEK